MAINVNCSCDDTFPRKTMADMRADVMDALGFIDPLSGAPTRSLGDLRQDIRDRLGLADPITATRTRSLGDLINDIAATLGYAGQSSSYPDGFDDEVTDYINQAQQTTFTRIEMDQGSASAPPLLTLSGDMTTLDYVPVFTLALGMMKGHMGQPDAKVYFDQFEKYMADRLQRNPPSIDQMLTQALQSAHQTVYRRFEMGNSGAMAIGAFADDADTTSVDYQPVFLLALANVKAKIGQADAKALMGEYEQFMRDQLRRTPPNAVSLVNRQLQLAQEKLYRRFDLFRLERWYTWTLDGVTRFYGVGGNDEQTGDPACTKSLDPRQVTWVGVCDSQDNAWRSLRHGIPPTIYTSGQTGVPTHYEIRQCIELWPLPVAGWKLRVKGMFGLDPFAVDADTCTIDWQAIELVAIAECKAYYKMDDAQMAAAEAHTYIGDLVAGSHMTARYIPGRNAEPAGVRPVMV